MPEGNLENWAEDGFGGGSIGDPPCQKRLDFIFCGSHGTVLGRGLVWWDLCLESFPQQPGRGCSYMEVPGDICTVVAGYICCARCLPACTQGQGPAGRSTGGASWQEPGKGIRFLRPTQGGSHLLRWFEPSYTVGCFPTCPLGSSGEYLAQRTQGEEPKRAKASLE